MPDMAVLELVQLRSAALDLRNMLDRVTRRADSQILRRKFKRSGFQKPADANWAWLSYGLAPSQAQALPRRALRPRWAKRFDFFMIARWQI